MVLVANDEPEFYTHVDQRLSSRLQSAVRVSFGPYSDAVLMSILEDRVRWGLRDDGVSGEQLWRIADAAAGDARAAIGILRVAAREADRTGVGEITDSILE